MTPEQLFDRIEVEAAAYAAAKSRELALEDDRPAIKQAAILRIVGTENPITGKAHSGSSAEAIVETDPTYAAHRASQREATVGTIVARARHETAKLRAGLALNNDGVAA